jgi:putative hydrolase of the HAD superfamily
MRAVIFGYFGTLTDPGAEEYREPLAHRTGELLGVCRPRFWEALAGSFGECTIGVHGRTPKDDARPACSCTPAPPRRSSLIPWMRGQWDWGCSGCSESPCCIG